MSYKSIWEKGGLVIIVEDEATDEFLQISRALSEDSRVHDIQYIILDLISVNTFPIDSGIIEQLAILDTKIYKNNPHIKQAIVATQTVVKGFANMFQTYFELNNNDQTWDTKLFDNMEEAREWLNT